MTVYSLSVHIPVTQMWYADDLCGFNVTVNTLYRLYHDR